MTTNRTLERSIARWMADEAAIASAPGAIDHILTATSRVRPEPRWLALLKEPPMRIQSQVTVGTPTRRLIFIAVALVVLALAAGVAVVGSNMLRQSPRATSEYAWTAAAPGAAFHAPSNIAFDPKGNIWVADHGNSRFAIFRRDGTFVESWGSAGSGAGQFNLIRDNGDGYGAIAFEPDGSFYVLDVGNLRVQRFDAKRQFVGQWGSPGTGPRQYSDPTAIVVGADGSVYVLDDARKVVEHYDREGNVLGSVVVLDRLAGEKSTNGLAIDGSGNLYVSHADAPWQLEKLDPTGHRLAVFGDPSGPGRFTGQVEQVAVDGKGRVFITQGPNFSLRSTGILVFDPDGRYVAGIGPNGDGPGTLSFPTGILLDAEGNLYVENFSPSVPNGSIQMFRLGPPLYP